MFDKYILAIDEGTTGTRAVVYDRDSNIIAKSYSEITQFYPAPNAVEQDPVEIWHKTRAMVDQSLAKARLRGTDIAAIGLSTQSSTTVVWDRATGEPICPALVWQDTRGADFVDRLRDEWEARSIEHVGTTMRPSSSAIKLWWIMENVPGARERAENGELAFGTIDAWLIHNLTGGKVHATGTSNASQCRAYDMVNDEWYEEWLNFLGIPLIMFPEVRDDSGHFGETVPELFGAEIPIMSALRDQHAGLFGQGCVTPGTVKCTHGTGTFMDMNVGNKLVISRHGVSSMIAWRMNGETTYGMEGYTGVTGSAVQWLRDGAKLIEASSETEQLATSVKDTGGVYFVLALAGLSAPYWDPYARGMIIGITRGTKRAHIVRATLEGIVYATRDFLDTMRQDSGVDITSIKVDGGASRNDFLLQFQADMLDTEVVRSNNPEAATLGAAYMAGLAIGYWDNVGDCFKGRKVDRVFKPQMSAEEREQLYARWSKAVERCMSWAR